MHWKALSAPQSSLALASKPNLIKFARDNGIPGQPTNKELHVCFENPAPCYNTMLGLKESKAKQEKK